MSDFKYVVRFFDADNKYLYSIHVDPDALEDLLEDAKSNGKSFKVVAYKSGFVSEVKNDL